MCVQVRLLYIHQTSKYRLGLRLLGEVRVWGWFTHYTSSHCSPQLVIAGIVNQDVGLTLLQDMLTAVVTADRHTHSYLSVVLSFSRQFSEDYANILPRRHQLLLSKHGIKLPRTNVLTVSLYCVPIINPFPPQFIPASRQVEFSKLLCDYFSSLKKYLVHQHKEMQKRARKNRTILQVHQLDCDDDVCHG